MKLKTFAAAIMLCAVAPAVSFAQDAAGGGAGPLAACRSDADKLCANVDRGGGGRMRCLMENEGKLSAECKGAVVKIREARNAVRAACKADIDTLCGVQAGDDKDDGRGNRMRCLRDNQAKLSKGCSDALAALPFRGGNAGQGEEPKKQ